jgi:transposase, IS5 family
VIAEVPARGNPADDTMLEGAIEKAKAAGVRVRTVLADRGFGTPAGDAALARQGVRDAIIPRQREPDPGERSRSWRRRYRFRNGCEGRIAHLKRKGLSRTRLRGLPGAQTWVGGITFAHNLQRLATLS